MVTSGATFANGVVTPTTQSQSRPIILHRPFRSVAEMSYAFRGTPWKNIDFFTPESGDAALLDVFCVNEPPTDAVVAGKVNLNTKQTPVLKAILAGAYRDEFANLPTPPTSGTLPSLATAEAANLASMLRTITSGTLPYRGPLTNVADLVGHYCPPQTRNPVNNPDVYSYQSPATLGRYSNYAGFSAALSGTAQDGSDIWTTQSMSSRNIQRFREAPIRALTSCGQTRVWNLLIDVVAQSGRYLQNASSLDKFIVEGEKRYWVHVAIDRYTGQVIDTQVEAVTE